MIDEQIETMAKAVLKARHNMAHREGPYGIYLYGDYCIRDFRDVFSDSYGTVIERFEHRAAALDRHDVLTEMHWLKIALDAVK